MKVNLKEKIGNEVYLWTTVSCHQVSYFNMKTYMIKKVHFLLPLFLNEGKQF